MNVLLKVYSAIFINSAMLTIVAFVSSRKNISKLYRTIISIVVVEGAIFLFVTKRLAI